LEENPMTRRRKRVFATMTDLGVEWVEERSQAEGLTVAAIVRRVIHEAAVAARKAAFVNAPRP
jgi:hypothetical protein